MGRSKFPGKPSKHVNRKRVNVLPPSESLAESDNSVTVENQAENKQPGSKIRNGPEVPSISSNINTKLALKRMRKVPNKNSSKRVLISKMCVNKLAVKNKIASRKINRKPLTYFRNGIVESNNLVGKFVLPTRSVHSSRVIKPNKRFINMECDLTMRKKRSKKQNESESPASNDKNIGRIILRQARLKLHNQTPKGSDGPFSCNLSGNSSPPGTVTCGVCGAVRFYRFVKQARKFNIYSCESCRKFISKMIKRVSCKSVATSLLVCHKGQGTCHVPPIVRSQQMKLIKCAYRSRCPACWLKMCLRSFQIPLSLKESLAQLLPKSMQGSDVVFNNPLPLLWPTANQDSENSNNQAETVVKSRPVRVREPKATKNTVPQVQGTSDVKRQKLDLKGPRVKHVCRSASIVLGQPLAVFPQEPEKKESCVKNDSPENKDSLKSQKIYNFSENESSDCDKLPKLPLVISDHKKERNHRVPSTMSYTPFESMSNEKPNILDQNVVATDYWKDNNLIDDISENGFCLIASQQFPMPAICFLCGSAGREALLYCSLCCEPYHPYCLEQTPPITNNNREVLWFCPRCSKCSGCNGTNKKKYHCCKCYKTFHLECFNSSWNKDDQLQVCSKCLSCKDCGKEIPQKYLGNLRLCTSCHKLRRKNSSCPVCDNSLDDDKVAFSMIMECSKCSKWVHAKCDGLSEEFYYILSLLPDSVSVKYSCKSCSSNSTSCWKRTIQCELKSGFNRILRLLSKNRGLKSKTTTPYDDFGDSDCAFNKPENDVTVPKPELTLLDVKCKLISNGYSSVKSFNQEMEEALGSKFEALNIYHFVLNSVFPWYINLAGSESMSDRCEDILQSTENEDVCEQIECVAVDSRYCSFCKSIGDGLSHLESRLLYCGDNEWVHINCAFWSSEVYEEIDGSLQNVKSAIYRGRMMRCSYCKQRGAAVGCCFKNCPETYHFICARTAKCYFMYDKTVYCCNHELPRSSTVINLPTEFNIKRTIFVDITKKSYCNIDKINVMVGSLCVKSLGKIIQPISDHEEAIIPTDYTCNRLFWSTVEPWKLVNYKLSTSTLNSPTNSSIIDRNFTVDHALPKSMVERKLREIYLFQKDLEKKKSDFEDEGADLLSPEITDAIFEELPHELLDGISVQDIFPKLMSYEDFMIDSKPETSDIENISEQDEKKCDKVKKRQPKSCNLTLSCKLDNKKRKVSPRESNLFLQLLQVDGNFDDSSSECNSPTGEKGNAWSNIEEPVTCERCHCTYRTQASYKRHLDVCEVICSSESDSDSPDQEDALEPVVLNEKPTVTSFECYNEVHTQTFLTSDVVVPQSETIIPPVEEIVQPVNEPVTFSTNQTTQFCLNQSIPICAPILSVNSNQTFGLEIQPQVQPFNPVSYGVDRFSIKNVKPKPRIRPREETEGIVISPANSSVILQQIPTYVDTMQPSAQNVQYVTTITPQIQSQPLMQLQSENNLISLVQPTMIVQQPRVMENQLVISNGSLSWTSQPVQPVYYGYETIVQNTVMQSQQFLPTAVPGLLAANSSYSTTTQVFQSKIEPVLDVAASSFVLVNTGHIVNPQPIQILQNTQPQVNTFNNVLQATDITNTKFTPFQKQRPAIAPATTTNSITLPTAPIATNVVIPTPKRVVPTQSRPMSRVLPMQTHKEHIKPIEIKKEIKSSQIKVIEPPPVVENPVQLSEPLKPQEIVEAPVEKLFYSKQIAPLKPIKSLPLSEKQNRPLEEKKPPEFKVLQSEKKEDENAPAILYTIETQDGFKYSSTSIAELWTKVFEAVQNARAAHNMPPLPNDSNVMNSLRILGLKTSGLKYLIEQLPGATKCNKYKPTFNFPSKLAEIEDEPLHTHGCARCIPHNKKDEPYDMFDWLASRHRKPHSLVYSESISRRGSVNNLPMAMRFRQLKLTSKYSVGVYRSQIHRRGLFCLRDFEAGEMVIEYSGEVIRSVLTDKREKFYNSKGIGCYMFRIDDNLVVDATMTGNAARFINHSCDPNCYSKVVEILGHKHIIIFALRKIICGEELTYDYKFPIEEDKIPCTCGTRRCRKFLN